MWRDHRSYQGKNYTVSDLKRSQFRLGLNFLKFGLFSEHPFNTTPDTLMASVKRAKYLDRLEEAPFINRLAAPLATNRLIQMLN